MFEHFHRQIVEFLEGFWIVFIVYEYKIIILQQLDNYTVSKENIHKSLKITLCNAR